MAERQGSVKEGEPEGQNEQGKGNEKKNKGGKKWWKQRKGSADGDAEEEETITEAIINSSEIQRMIDLGLGRGVDATDSCPWLNKSSFQVREVTEYNLIGTDEGGILKGYVTEIASSQSFQTDMSASVPVSQQVSIGIDSELSRSYSCNRKAVGRKVITRTISFQMDFTDLTARKASFEEQEKQEEEGGEVVEAKPKKKPQKRLRSRQQSMGSGGGRSVSFAKETSEEIGPLSLTFEERLCKWIVTQLIIDGDFADRIDEEADPVETTIALLNDDTQNVRPEIRENCRQFVNHFHVTHYVSAIELGASKYRVMSDEEYHTQMTVGGNVGVEQMASVAVSQKAQWSSRNRQSEVTKIGRFGEKGLVKRGTSGEAVVGVKLQPISSLIRIKKLQKILQNQIKNYIDSSEENSKIGPFYITCDSERLFLTVNDQFQVVATRDEKQAKKFFIIPNDDGLTPFEFSIVNKPESVYKRIKPVPRYLCATMDAWGNNPGPLPLKLNAKETKSRLTLHSRMMRSYNPVDITPWVNGREIFYINCKHRAVKGDSYLCIKPREGSTGEFVTACVRSIKSHDEGTETYMLFRLLKPGKLRAIENANEEAGEEGTTLPPPLPLGEGTDGGDTKQKRGKQEARRQSGGGGKKQRQNQKKEKPLVKQPSQECSSSDSDRIEDD